MEYLSPKDGGLPQGQSEISPKRLRSELLLLSLFLSTSVALIAFCSYASANPSPVVRVMVEREKSTIQINGFDLMVIDAERGRNLAHEDRRAMIKVRCSLGEKMEIEASSRKMKAAGPIQVTSLGGFIRVGESQYRDDLYVYSFNGDCIVVNHVDLEKYVAGLLNSEMSARWSMATLMAQAIAARTYAIYQMKESSTAHYRKLRPPFDLDSSVRDQVYEGAHQERYKAMRAVQETRGLILTFHDKPIKAFYHSTCGGRTESAEKVWGVKVPYIKPVKCDFCVRSPRYNWAYSMAEKEVERRLKNESLLHGDLVYMRVIDHNAMGRVDRIEIKGTRGSNVVSATRLREAIGTASLKSTDFEVARAAGQFNFIGRGSGHAVGMCQWGAKTMGEKGYSFAQILKQYYPLAQISKLY